VHVLDLNDPAADPHVMPPTCASHTLAVLRRFTLRNGGEQLIHTLLDRDVSPDWTCLMTLVSAPNF
jgi:hypothetical protein